MFGCWNVHAGSATRSLLGKHEQLFSFNLICQLIYVRSWTVKLVVFQKTRRKSENKALHRILWDSLGFPTILQGSWTFFCGDFFSRNVDRRAVEILPWERLRGTRFGVFIKWTGGMLRWIQPTVRAEEGGRFGSHLAGGLEGSQPIGSYFGTLGFLGGAKGCLNAWLHLQVLSIHSLQNHAGIFTKMLLNDGLLDAIQQITRSGNILLHHTKAHVKPPDKGSSFPMHQVPNPKHPFGNLIEFKMYCSRLDFFKNKIAFSWDRTRDSILSSLQC